MRFRPIRPDMPEIVASSSSWPSWRDTTSEAAQNDLDGLLNAVLPFAEQTLAKHGELFPFGAGVDVGGQVAMLAADPELGEHPASNQVLDALYQGARAEAASRRAVAFVADVRANVGDALRIELAHREGVALVLLIPYSRTRFTKKMTLGQMSGGAGERRIFVD
ncbi:MAG TPA: hypothetical protein VKB75_06445 [Jatrophihabitans sp.]|nr:hypothetical protein [Jatrophihabitans sp.]